MQLIKSPRNIFLLIWYILYTKQCIHNKIITRQNNCIACHECIAISLIYIIHQNACTCVHSACYNTISYNTEFKFSSCTLLQDGFRQTFSQELARACGVEIPDEPVLMPTTQQPFWVDVCKGHEFKRIVCIN